MIRGISAVAAAAVLASVGLSSAAGQPLSFRLESSDQAFTPVHSYVEAEFGDEVLVFTGITGFGLHTISSPKGPEPIFQTAADYNQGVIVADRATGTVTTASLAHLPESIRFPLLVTNASAFQRGDTLYIYGGYGPLLDESDVVTKAFVTAVDLAAVSAAVGAGEPIPASAFTVTACESARSTGAEIFKLDEGRFVLYGGKEFTGDYPGHTFERYSTEAFVFDLDVSADDPVQVIGEADPFVTTVMQRRDLNGQAATVKDAMGNLTHGFIVTGGVFRFAAIYFDTPVSWMDGDTFAEEDTSVSIKMNMYHSPSASFFSESSGQNRIVLFGGITAFDSVESSMPNFFNPWSDTITENVFDGTTFVEERALGNTPLPIVNGKLIVREDLPKAANGQLLLDELPPNEIRLGSIWGGIHAAEPANEPETWASGDVLDVYVVKGVRGDLTGNGVTDAADLATLIGQWGASGVTSDLNWDGEVNAADLAVFISYWGRDFPG